MKFYGTVRRYRAFHASASCCHLRKAVEVIELAEHQIEARTPCGVCFPAFPRLSVLHRLCSTCGHEKVTPCSHNGAVQAIVPVPGRTPRRRWVWPEQAYRYALAPSSKPV